MPWSRARAAAASSGAVALLVNPVEFHGPHLSLHNDALVARGLAAELERALERRGMRGPLAIAGELEVGVEPVPGPGSRATSLAQASALVVEACVSLAELGAKRVVLLTFHGAPLHARALHAGIEALARRGVPAVAPLDAALRMIGDLDPHRFADVLEHVPEGERARLAAELPLDYHAGFLETSVALALAPDAVDPAYRTLPPCPDFAPDRRLEAASRAARRAGRAELARELATAAHFVAWRAVRPFPGYTGRPHLASAEAGRAIVRHLTDVLADATWDAIGRNVPSPPPPMSWLATATLGGRLMRNERLRARDVVPALD